MKKLLLFIFLAFFAAIPGFSKSTIELDKLIKGDLWETTPDFFTKGKLFKWNSNKKKMLRYAAAESKKSVKLFKMPLVECLVAVKDDKPKAMRLYFYSRGDCGVITRSGFREMLQNIELSCSEIYGSAKSLPPKKLKNKNKIYRKSWLKSPCKVYLSWSYEGKLTSKSRTKFVPEYITLTISNSEIEKTSKKLAINKDYRDAFKNNLKCSSTGEVYIDNIPMVNQGRKGYCVAATSERVLRYFGQDVDQHVIAQITETTARGTVLDKLLKAMDDVERRLNIKVRTLYIYKMPTNLARFKRVLKYYNKFAKKQGCRKIRESDITSGNTVNAGRAYDMMVPSVWVQTKAKVYRNDLNKFWKNVKRYIDKGYPCVWSVMLGIVKEKGIPQLSGGHQRLIIGYNEKKKTIIYSDSWGKGHEKKEMNLIDAWAMTLALNLYAPRAVRMY